MEQLVKLLPIADGTFVYLLIDIVIAILLLLAIRSLSGLHTKISVREELGERDNFAFGISMAGRMLSLTLVMSAVVGRHIGMSYESAALSMLMFGIMGIVLVKIGRIAHDKLVLNRLDKDTEIGNKNISVGLVDASSAVASAIITKSIIDWAQGTDVNAYIAVFSGVLVVLTVLLLCTRIYEYNFAESNQSQSFQKTLSTGQVALAVQHSGNLIGIAIAVSSASKILAYNPTSYVSNITGWLIIGLSLALILMVISSITKRIVLIGVKWRSEVMLQHNVGIASIEAVISIGISLLFTSVFVMV